MDRSTALAVFTRLEEARNTDVAGDPPTYDVRLDASSARDAAPPREYRVFVRGSRALGFTERDDWLYVLETASEQDVQVEVENNGIALY